MQLIHSLIDRFCEWRVRVWLERANVAKTRADAWRFRIETASWRGRM